MLPQHLGDSELQTGGEPSWSCRQLSPVDGLLVLRLLMGQVLGKSRALKANGSEFTFLFYCVTLGRLPK